MTGRVQADLYSVEIKRVHSTLWTDMDEGPGGAGAGAG